MNSKHKPPILVALGIILNKYPEGPAPFQTPSILISQRPEGKPYAGYWEFPGGKCDQGESLPSCVQRELMEELGVEVTVHEALTPIIHQYDHAHVHLNAFLCTIKTGQPQALEVSSFKWVEPDELSDLSFPEGNEPLLREILSRFAQSD